MDSSTPTQSEFETLRHQRREQAWHVARQAADLLRTRYHARRVVVFGSLVDSNQFHPWSDVDLAVWGIAREDYFEAVARVLDVGGEIKIDLILADRAKPSLQAAVTNGIDV